MSSRWLKGFKDAGEKLLHFAMQYNGLKQNRLECKIDGPKMVHLVSNLEMSPRGQTKHETKQRHPFAFQFTATLRLRKPQTLISSRPTGCLLAQPQSTQLWLNANQVLAFSSSKMNHILRSAVAVPKMPPKQHNSFKDQLNTHWNWWWNALIFATQMFTLKPARHK